MNYTSFHGDPAAWSAAALAARWAILGEADYLLEVLAAMKKYS